MSYNKELCAKKERGSQNLHPKKKLVKIFKRRRSVERKELKGFEKPVTNNHKKNMC
jgi:hypothetical protein